MSSRTLGLQLSELVYCGTALYPALAEGVAPANAAVAGASNDRFVFEREGTVPGTPGISGLVTGAFYPIWDQTRDQFQRLLADTMRNYYDTGDALVAIAEEYAATDEEAAAVMNSQHALAASGELLPGGSESANYPIADPADRREPIYPSS